MTKEVEFKISPSLEQVNKRLGRIVSKVRNVKVAHWKASIILDQWVLQNFRTEGGKVGKWEPLKAGGRYVNNILDTKAKILQDTGILKRSFTPFHNKRTAGIGSYIPYSKPHNEGVGRLPVRRMLPDRMQDAQLMLKLYKVYESHVRRQINAG